MLPSIISGKAFSTIALLPLHFPFPPHADTYMCLAYLAAKGVKES